MLLINKIFRNTYSKQLRNLLSIKPSFDIIDYTSQGLSVSDAFFGEQTIVMKQFLSLQIF